MIKLERYLASNSRLKKELVDGNGHRILENPGLLRSVQIGEDDLYRDLADLFGLKDGLIFPYIISHKGNNNELPFVIADTKADKVEEFLDSEGKDIDVPIDVNDSVFAVGDKSGNLFVAVNKTNPAQYGDDVERLTSLVRSHEGAHLYSVGANIEINPVDRKRKWQMGRLKVGRLNSLTYAQIQEILGEHLPRTKSFDLKFLITERLVELPEYFEGRIDRSDGSWEQWQKKPAEISYRQLQLAAHGMNPFNGQILQF